MKYDFSFSFYYQNLFNISYKIHFFTYFDQIHTKKIRKNGKILNKQLTLLNLIEKTINKEYLLNTTLL